MKLTSIVEEVIHAGPLLEELKRDAEERAVHLLLHTRLPGHEAFEPRAETDRALTLQDLAHLGEVRLDERVLRVVLAAPEARQGQPGALPVRAGGEPPRRLGQGEDSDAEGKREGDAETDDDAPAGVAVLDIPHPEVDQVGDEDAHRNHELVGRDDGAADLARRALALEHGDADRQVSDAEARYEAAHHHVHPAFHGGDLDNVSDNEDDDAEGETLSPAEPVSRAAEAVVLANRRRSRRLGWPGVAWGGGGFRTKMRRARREARRRSSARRPATQ